MSDSHLVQCLRAQLPTERCAPYGRPGGGCINQGAGYDTDAGHVFVKYNEGGFARRMFDGELASLRAIDATGTVRCPKPIKVLDLSPGAALVTEYVDMGGRGGGTTDELFGTQLAMMHKHNGDELRRAESDAARVTGGRPAEDEQGESVGGRPMFGFDVATCCGRIEQDNTWTQDWLTFYASRRLKPQIDMLLAQHGDRELQRLWPELERRLPVLFDDLAGEPVVPSLVHGDLWAGNVCADERGRPVIFDAAAFYGHSEYDFGIASIFGGIPPAAAAAYFKVVPESAGRKKRLPLYQLFHYLNHWNHFGSAYRGSSLDTLRELL